MKFRIACALVAFLSLVLSLNQPVVAQTSIQTASALPRLVRFGGTAKDLNGNPLIGVLSITFALYSEQTGGAPLWLETQNVTADSTGHYAVLLGSTKPDGLPAELFTSEQARWVAVQVSGQVEQPRVLLVSAPYAFKAGDAETVGGFPPSAFVLAAPASTSGTGSMSGGATISIPESPIAAAASEVTTTGGTVSAVPLFTTATNIQNSLLTQSGTTAINVGGKLNLSATGTATAVAGFNSRPLNFVASVFNSSTATPITQNFQWQAEPLNSDKTTATGTLNLLYGSGTAIPSETGLRISSKGIFTFAIGQTFPSTGTITGIATAPGSGLAGGGVAGVLKLSVPTAGITNAMLANSSLTVTPGSGLAGGGQISLGSSTTLGLIRTCTTGQILRWNGATWTCSTSAAGSVTSVATGTGLTGGPITTSGTLSINTTVVPQLNANNTFTGTQSITGSLGINTGKPAESLDVTSGNAIVRGPANFKTTGNTAFLYVGDTNHPIEAIWNTGLAIGAWKAPQALLIQDQTGYVGIGKTIPAYPLDVNGAGNFSSGTQNGVTGTSTSSGSSGIAGFGVYGVYGASNHVGGAGGYFVGFTGPVDVNGYPGVVGVGGSGGPADCCINGGDGVQGFGASGSGGGGGIGVIGYGADGGDSVDEDGSPGVWGTGGVATANSPFNDGLGGFFQGANGGAGSMGGDGVFGLAGSGYAGDFDGNLNVSGTITAGVKDFRIDHPLDPANKYLVHTSVESSEMMNIYSGNVTTDAQGEATVQLPEWFEALNNDFRYQLTVIGQFAQAIVAREIRNHEFAIRTNAPKVKVSWQVAGVRQDAYAKAHPLLVEEEKDAQLRGFYIHPELYGAPGEKQIEWARHPQVMKRMKEDQTRARLRRGAPQPAAALPIVTKLGGNN